MKALGRRLDAIERVRGDNPLAHLTDEELDARIVALIGEMEAHGVEMPDGWQSSPDWLAVVQRQVGELVL